MTTLRIGHANGHNEHSLIRFLANTEWDSFGCAEVERLIDDLRPLGQVIVTKETFDRAKDAPIVVSAKHKVIISSTRRVSRALGRRGSDLNRVAPARVLTEVRYAHPLADALDCSGIAHINVHPVAGPKQLNGRNPLAPLTRQYRKAWKAARRSWREAERAGYLCILTSDAQMSARSTRPWSPGRQARRLHARTWSTGIDWLMFDSRLRLDGTPKTRKLYDHTGFIASLTERN